VCFWYFWLTIQNTTTSQARSLFRVAGEFISFPWRAVAESPARLAWKNPILGPKVPDRGFPSLARFSAPKKRNKKKEKKRKKEEKKREKGKRKTKKRVPRRAISTGHRV
jgi:hypothetical protein